MLVVATQALVLEVQLVFLRNSWDIHVFVVMESLEQTVTKPSSMDLNIVFLRN